MTSRIRLRYQGDTEALIEPRRHFQSIRRPVLDLKLFLVDAVTDEGDHLDNLFWATCPEDAVAQWSEGWELEDNAYDMADLTPDDDAEERQLALDAYIADSFSESGGV